MRGLEDYIKLRKQMVSRSRDDKDFWTLLFDIPAGWR
jgi:hypothetical protein